MTIDYPDTHGKTINGFVVPFSWAPLFCEWNGSVIQRIFLEYILVLLASFLIIIIKIHTGVFQVGLVENIAGIYNSTGAVLTFVMGFYTFQVYNRWWTVRLNLNELSATIVDFALRLHSIATAQPGEEPSDVSLFTLKLVRWLNLSYGLVVRQLYFKSEMVYSSFDSMQDAGLMKPEERVVLERLKTKETGMKFDKLSTRRSSNPMMDSEVPLPVAWCLKALRECVWAGGRYGINASVVTVLEDNCSRIRRIVGVLYTYKNTPMPLGYRQLVNLSVRLYAFALVILAGNLSTAATGVVTQVTWENMYDLIFVSLDYLIYVGWLAVAEDLANPYRNTGDGLDLDKYAISTHLASFVCLMAMDYDEFGVSDVSNENSLQESWDALQRALPPGKYDSWYVRVANSLGLDYGKEHAVRTAEAAEISERMMKEKTSNVAKFMDGNESDFKKSGDVLKRSRHFSSTTLDKDEKYTTSIFGSMGEYSKKSRVSSYLRQHRRTHSH
uniref:Bestrophin homolog n=1 Tax=Timspurckia oligopyrenoides TaxID=708627 RepID=A0A7S0ZHQ0_9RHOD|mmetsp:Transcript_5748/g.10144  ORF Transcript_5748/g.10144 Transcript_5748/m.10144 type:complete len:498 (+) Transcript_5748:209-1702(+)|eukprot:CAMPEP_0182448598 /NCGR_PEP_ID=MMETSP1172-20130603/28367_1 /TAXON_ID=708627 /ORGANISM="Timspurckia oligopyrenoides, Strain CCMP3278" /LENGTH=497 /DNA_ID=CAMNT_0024645533 /DNA_START=176 /DNA_END=1669 /DNA_ORIENTATION=-